MLHGRPSFPEKTKRQQFTSKLNEKVLNDDRERRRSLREESTKNFSFIVIVFSHFFGARALAVWGREKN